MDKETLDKINALTRRDFKAEELYTFPVVLCGNEIDRDFERFSDDALEEMAPLFIGKTIIADHNPTADNQVARLYDTAVISDPETITKDGRPYKYLKGFAYMARTDANADLITEIDAGIKKEVSVGCSSARRICSVCGSVVNEVPCEHIKGHEYGGKTCCHIIDGITDAYELSFVPVPAQPDAGIVKHYTPEKEEPIMEEFTPITTQEALDAVIGAAIAEAVKAFDGYISPEDHQKALDDLNDAHKSEMLKSYRTKAALMAGLPEELADRLTGDTEEALCKDAQKLAGFTKSAGTPHFTAGGGEMDEVEKAFYARNKNLYPGKENA